MLIITGNVIILQSWIFMSEEIRCKDRNKGIKQLKLPTRSPRCLIKEVLWEKYLTSLLFLQKETLSLCT